MDRFEKATPDRRWRTSCGFQKAAYVALGGTAMQEIRVRCGGDDKVEGGGTPFHEWRWMDRLEKATPDRGFSRRL
jgi:hypothetical protein